MLVNTICEYNLHTYTCLVEQDRRRLLSFVVVGGGPTGVEVAAELYDMVHEDLRRLYPELIKDVRIRIIELQSHLLSTYDRAISDYTKRVFDRYVVACCWSTCYVCTWCMANLACSPEPVPTVSYTYLHEILHFQLTFIHKEIKCKTNTHTRHAYRNQHTHLYPPCVHSNGIEAVLNARVAAVEQFSVKVVDAQTEQVTDIPFGACVWATGVAMNPLVRELQQKLPEQANFRSLVTDNLLRVKGSKGTIFALGRNT